MPHRWASDVSLDGAPKRYVHGDDEDDEDVRLASELLSSASLTSIMNDPSAPSPKLPALVIPSHSYYDESSISLTELYEHLRMVGYGPKRSRSRRRSISGKDRNKKHGHSHDITSDAFLRKELKKCRASVPDIYFNEHFDLEE